MDRDCPARAYAVDIPAECHCQKIEGHKGNHRCEHGFDFTDDVRIDEDVLKGKKRA